MTTAHRALAALVLLVASNACRQRARDERAPRDDQPAPSPPVGRACTLIGCSDQLAVRVSPRPAGDIWISVRDSSGTARDRLCNATSPCAVAGDTIVATFQDYAPAWVAVRVTDARKRRASAEGAPAYAELYPNGRECGAACRAGRIEVRWTP